MEPKELDFNLYVGGSSLKKFFPAIDGSPYSMTGSTITFIAQRASGNIEIEGTLEGSNDTIVSFLFDANFNLEREDFAYQIKEETSTDEVKFLFFGNTSIKDPSTLSQSVNSLIEGLKPDGVVLDENFKTQQIQYWRLYLQPLMHIPIADEDLNESINWPPLVNYLIAYLVIYDFLKKYARKAYADTFGSSETQGSGGVKKIETGPSSVEYFDSSSSLESIFKPNASGVTPYQEMAQEACMLSKRLRIYLPICGQLDHSPVIPIKAGRIPKKNPLYLLTKYYGS